MEPRVLAGIVAYQPDEEALASLVAAVAPDVAGLVVVANSALDSASERRLSDAAHPTPFAVIRPGRNVGLGEAYAAVAARAETAGAAFCFLLDQDSHPAAGTVGRLVAADARLVAAGERPAIVGPLPVAQGGAPVRLHHRRGIAPRPGLVPVLFAISSGSLVSLDALRSVGPFRADFFIDAIDVEWGMRAWSRGFSVWVAADVPMPHRLGRTDGPALGLTDQPPRRIYTFIRNQLAMLRLGHVPLGHKARTLAFLPARLALYAARERFSPAIRRAIGRGLRDGLALRLGPPPADL